MTECVTSSRARTSVKRLIEARTLLASGEARRIRLAAGLSLEKAAAEVGVSASAIYRWERGDRIPRSRGAVEYAARLLRLRDVMEPT